MTIPFLAASVVVAAAPLPSVDQPDDPPKAEPAAPAKSPSSDSPLDPPDKAGGPDNPNDVVVLDDGASEPSPEGTGPSESRPGSYAPSEQAIARDSDVEAKRTGKVKFKRDGSPQRFELEIKLGPYLPDVDRNYSGTGFGPYATVFGRTDSSGNAIAEPRKGLMTAFAFEYQFVYLAGPLGLALQGAYYRDKADAIVANPAPGESTRSEADSTKFNMFPIALQVVYRFELAADRWKVPLVPYAKAGPVYGFWWTRDGNGDIAVNSRGDKGRGGTLGWQVNFGGMLRLDFIEPGAAKKLDKTTGINHTYLFGEYQIARIDGFGQSDSISIGDLTYFVGLAIEF